MKQCYSTGGSSLIESSVHGAKGRAIKGACHRGSAPLPGNNGETSNGAREMDSSQRALCGQIFPKGTSCRYLGREKREKKGKDRGGGGERKSKIVSSLL